MSDPLLHPVMGILFNNKREETVAGRDVIVMTGL